MQMKPDGDMIEVGSRILWEKKKTPPTEQIYGLTGVIQ